MIVYLAGPYSGDIDANIAAARKIAIELWEKGYTVFCPHLNTARFEADCNCTYEDYIRGDLEILSRCDVIVMLPSWVYSKGAAIEYNYAKQNKMSIYYYPDLPPIAAR